MTDMSTTKDRPILLDVKGLKTYFFQRRGVLKAVDGVNFTVRAGESVGLVGESGSGKSMTCLSIMRLVPKPAATIVDGQILFNGEDLLGIQESEMRRYRGSKIAMVMQDPQTSMNPVFTIGNQVEEPIKLHLKERGVQAMQRALDALRAVRIPSPEDRLKQYPHQFSGGMRQRVMIAMALSCNPRLIIADEPTTALDVTIQAQILDLMKSLTTEFGVALIVITHNLGVVARYADRVNIMYAGKVIERGNAREIYANPRHPYTVGLLRSVPRLDLPRRAKLDPIEGQPPDLIHLAPGCSFEPRCKWAVDKCKTDIPELTEAGEGHLSACWRSEDLGPSAIDFLDDPGVDED